MKVKSISLKIVLLGLLSIALCFAGGTIALAGISKGGGGDFCKLCHTCGGDGGGGHKPLKLEYQGPEGCVNCHSSSDSSTTYTMTGGGETVTVPVVNYTGSEAPTTYLAGGNFWWVKEGKGGDDAKGHNIFYGERDENFCVYNEQDDTWTCTAPGDVGFATCGTNPCHANLHLPMEWGGADLDGKYGCEGCHFNVKHHADDHANLEGGLVDSADKGWYRFLSGHMSGDGHGVEGYEDGDWEATSDAMNHNEYLGYAGDHHYAGAFYNLGHTMTAFCCGCHGNYHIQEGSSQRHPADLVIPNSGEFAHAFGAEGSGTGIYDPYVPVARPSLNGTVSAAVTLATDMVMCLSCHRAHGSPYPKMLRWDLSGCMECHTQK